MVQLIYMIIYQKDLNYVLRNINKFLNPLFFNRIKLPPSGNLNIKTDSGSITLSTNQTSYLTKLLFWNGYKKFEYSALFEELIKEMSSFIDIGSNIGYYSLLACKSNPKLKAYAFEPALGPKHFLNKNIVINGFGNSIKTFDIALSDHEGEIDFYEVENVKYKYLKYNLAGEGNTGTKTTSRNFVKNRVETTTLNRFINHENISQIDLIKIDTEGTELDILNESIDVITKFEPIIICETLYNTTEDALTEFFLELNYKFYNHTNKGLELVSSLRRKKDDGVRNCFFVPDSKSELISKFVVKG